MDGKTKAAAPAGTLPRKTKVFYGFGEIGRGFSITLQTTFLIFYLVNYAGIPAGVVGTMVLVARVWDAVNDPLMGYIVDNTNSKRGRARPYLLYCAVPAGLFLFLLFAIPPSFSPFAKAAWAYVAYIGTGMMFTALDVPYNTLMVTLTNNPKDRISLSMSKYIIGALGTLLPAGLIPVLAATSDNPGRVYTICAGVFAALGAGCYLAVYFSSKELPAPRKAKLGFAEGFKVLLKNPPWMQVSLLYFLYSTVYAIINGALLFYATSVLRRPELVTPILLAILAVLAIGSAVANPIVARVGKRNAVLGGLVLALASLAVRAVNMDSSIPLMITCLCLQFLGMGYCVVLGNPMISDTVLYGEWKTGKRVESLSFSSVTFGNKLGLGIGAAMLSYMLDYTGYVENSVEQNASVIRALYLSEIWLPIIFVVLMLVLMLFYRLDKKLPGITGEIEARRREETV